MATILGFTGKEINDVIDGRYNSFRQAIGDSQYTVGSPLAVPANTETLLTNDALLSSDVSAPSYITSRWDATNSKIAMPEELDAPTYVNDITLTFDPTVSAAGKGVIKLYIDESGTRDFSTDPLIRSYDFEYKSVAEAVSIISTWFFGDATGFDAKNNGVYFTIETDANGDLYEIFFSIYRT